MVQIRQRAAAADSDEARVAVFGENHGYTCPSCICPTRLSKNIILDLRQVQVLHQIAPIYS